MPPTDSTTPQPRPSPATGAGRGDDTSVVTRTTGRGATGPDTSDVAEEKGREVASTASDEAARLRGDARDRAQDVAQDAREHVRGVADVAVTQVRDRADEQVQRAGGGLRQASDQMQALAAGRTEDAGPFGDYVRSAAGALGEWADRLEDGGIQRLAGDMSRFARRKPGQFLAGAFAAGVLAGRIGRNVQAADVEVPSSPSDDRSPSTVLTSDPSQGGGTSTTDDATSSPDVDLTGDRSPVTAPGGTDAPVASRSTGTGDPRTGTRSGPAGAEISGTATSGGRTSTGGPA